jgi:hypothetical protein
MLLKKALQEDLLSWIKGGGSFRFHALYSRGMPNACATPNTSSTCRKANAIGPDRTFFLGELNEMTSGMFESKTFSGCRLSPDRGIIVQVARLNHHYR